MKKFILHWLGGRTETVEGTDIADACRRAGIGAGALAALDYYGEGDTTIMVAGQAECACAYHADGGTACQHDLARIGIK